MPESTVILAFLLAGLIVLANYLGVFRRSYREAINGSLDAIFVRCGVFSWELLIAAKGTDAGIRQGTFLLPSAKARAKQVGSGQRSIL